MVELLYVILLKPMARLSRNSFDPMIPGEVSSEPLLIFIRDDIDPCVDEFVLIEVE